MKNPKLEGKIVIFKTIAILVSMWGEHCHEKGN